MKFIYFDNKRLLSLPFFPIFPSSKFHFVCLFSVATYRLYLELCTGCFSIGRCLLAGGDGVCWQSTHALYLWSKLRCLLLRFWKEIISKGAFAREISQCNFRSHFGSLLAWLGFCKSIWLWCIVRVQGKIMECKNAVLNRTMKWNV